MANYNEAPVGMEIYVKFKL